MRRRHLPLVPIVAATAVAGAVWIRRVVLPGRPSDVPTGRPRRIPDPDARPSPDGTGVRVTVNPDSGQAWSTNPIDELRTGLPAAEIVELGPDDDLATVLADGLDDAIVAVGAAGGDGTLSTAAAVALERDLTLVAVPAGTFNHLARDLGLDEPADAIEAVRAGTVVRIDVGTVDSGDGTPPRTFLNTLSFGGYTAIVDARDRLRPRLGKWLALAVALARELPQMEPLHLELDGQRRLVWLGWIGNGRYAPAGFGPSWREQLDDGLLDVRLVLGDRRLARVRLVVEVLAGRLEQSPVYQESQCEQLTVTSLDGPLRLAVDGETFDGGAHLTVAKRRRALAVAVPPN